MRAKSGVASTKNQTGIKVRCPRCAASLVCPANWTAAAVSCSRCGTIFKPSSPGFLAWPRKTNSFTGESAPTVTGSSSRSIVLRGTE
jgi:hypothetical protein